MDTRQFQVIILVARLDQTSLMALSKQLQLVLTQEGISTDIFEWRVALKERTFGQLFHRNNNVRPTLVISCGAIADILSVILRTLKRSRNVRYVSWIHCHPWPDLRWERPLWLAMPYYLLWRASLIFKHRIVCVSADVAHKLPTESRKKGLAILNPVVEISLPLKIESLASETGFSAAVEWIRERHKNGDFVLYSYGLLRKRKNFQQVVSALGRNKNLSLLIFGSGPECETLLALGRELKLGLRLQILPFVLSPARLCPWVDAYVSNTHSEGFGLANVEAVLTGVQVLIPAWPVNKEVLGGFPNAKFFQPDSDISFDTALNEIIKSKLGAHDFFPVRESVEKINTNPYTEKRFKDNWLEKVIYPSRNELENVRLPDN